MVLDVPSPCTWGVLVLEGRAEDVRALLYAIRTAAESMAVTPLRLTNAVGMPWRRVCSARSMQARAGSCAVNAKRRKRAAVDRCVQAMDVWKIEPNYACRPFLECSAVACREGKGFRVRYKASLL